MKKLVTGGAGFIGSHLINRLLNNGNEVVCIDNFSNGKIEFLSKALKNSKFSLYDFDLTNLEKLDEVFNLNNFEKVYHFAANSDIQLGIKSVDIDLDNTFISTINILKCMSKYNTKKIVFASSSAIYGEINDTLHEDIGPLFPISNYGAGKLASEAFISAFSTSNNIKAWIIRFPNVVGANLTHGVLYDFLNKLEVSSKELIVLGDGNQKKPYLYVDDLLEAIEIIENKANNSVNYYNVSADSQTTVKEIVNILINITGLNKLKIIYSGGDRGWLGDIPKFKYDLVKIKELKWKPKFSSNEAVKKSLINELKNRKTQ
jgi:UDP-glucose 4-epimerase